MKTTHGGRQTSTRLPSGIVRDRNGYRAYVRVEGRLRAKRFPADTAIEDIQIWRLRERLRKVEPVEPDAGPEPGTLAADVAAYLEIKRSLPTYHTRTAMMRAWVEELGPGRDRRTVTSLEVSQILARWQREKHYAASTLNHHRSALADFFTRLDPTGANPVRGVPKFREPAAKPRGLSYRVVRAILAAMPRWQYGAKGKKLGPSKARAMCAVLAYTGMPPAVIRQLRPEHVLWDARAVVMPARRKGAGTSVQRRALTRQGVAALRVFAAANAWGGVAGSTLLVVFRRAAARAWTRNPELTIPFGVRPYDLRHSYGEAVFRATRSLAVTAGLLGHLDERTTKRYVGGAVDDVERASADLVSRRLR